MTKVKVNSFIINNYNTSKLYSYVSQLDKLLNPGLDWYVSGGSVVRAPIQKEIDSADIDIFAPHSPKYIASCIEEDKDIHSKNKPFGEKTSSKPNNLKYFSQALQKNLNIIHCNYFNETRFDFDVCTVCINHKNSIVRAKHKALEGIQNMYITMDKGSLIYNAFPMRYAKYKRMGFSFDPHTTKTFNDVIKVTNRMRNPEQFPFAQMNPYL